MILDDSNIHQQHTWQTVSVRRNNSDCIPAPTPERHSVTPLPLRPFHRPPTPSDQTQNDEPYALTTQRVRSHVYSPLRERGLVPQSVAFARSQQAREAVLDHSRATNLNEDDALETRRSRNQAPSEYLRDRSPDKDAPRFKSRSPVRSPRPYVDDPQPTTHRQHSTPTGSEAGRRPKIDAEEVGHDKAVDVSGVIIPGIQPEEPGHATNFGTRLSLVEIQERKNMYSICIPCWASDLVRDHESLCSERRRRGKTCAYAVCPARICHLDVKCPAVHIYPGIPLVDRKVGTSMHLITLLGLDRPCIHSYNVDGIQAIHDDVRSGTVHLCTATRRDQTCCSAKQGL